jgi:hypothetical protein
MNTQQQYENALRPVSPLYDNEEELEIRKELRKSVPPPRSEAGPGAIVGAICGAVIGAIAGPPGIAAGSALGAAMGAAAGAAMFAADHAEAEHDRALDNEIGVTSGDLGAAKTHRDSIHGLYSGASAGMLRSSRPPASGPMSGM